MSDTGQDWKPVQLLDHVVSSRCGNKAADEHSSWQQHLTQSAEGQAESLGAQLKVSYNNQCVNRRMHENAIVNA